MVELPSADRGRTVYGMSVTGLPDVEGLGPVTTSTDEALIPVRVRQSSAVPPHPHALDHDRSGRVLSCGRQLHLDRAAGLATFYGPALSQDLLAHPYLGPVAVTFNRWAGREAFHAGAFVAAGRAWMLLGPRTAGKSTLIAALAAAGHPILADDIVVIDNDEALAGPRTVDLREPIPAAAHADGWSPPTAGSSARLGTRTRLALPVAAPRVPIGGWFFLGWSDRTELTPVPLATLLGRLAGRRGLPGLPSDPSRILALASRPAWDLRRPKTWADLPLTVDRLVATATRAPSRVPSR